MQGIGAWTMDFLITALSVAWDMAREAGFYVIFGLLAAGLVHLFVSRQWMVRHLGGRGFGAVAKAALIGAPLPLCSCSVLPAVYALRNKGASRGATVSFLVSTPETGIDSIALTWALMGPVMAIVRPVAAVATGMIAGLLETIRERHEPPPIVAGPACSICNSDTCEHVPQVPRWRRFVTFVLFEMGDDVGPTLTLGFILAGIVTAAVPPDFFTTYLNDPWLSMLVMLAIGLPLYVCATASTPLAAALILKGLNPGAALVLLLVGPATNLATVVMVSRMLGKASAAMYVAVIAVMALACGALVNLAAGPWIAESVRAVAVGAAGEFLPAWLSVAGAILLLAYLAHSVGRWGYKKLLRRPVCDACGKEAAELRCAVAATGGDCDCDGGEAEHADHAGHAHAHGHSAGAKR
jgi:hypothetical protein